MKSKDSPERAQSNRFQKFVSTFSEYIVAIVTYFIKKWPHHVHWWLRIWVTALNNLVDNFSHSNLHARTIVQWQSRNFSDHSFNYNNLLHPNSQLANQNRCLQSWHSAISRRCDLIWLCYQTHLAEFGYSKYLVKKKLTILLFIPFLRTLLAYNACLISPGVFWFKYILPKYEPRLN